MKDSAPKRRRGKTGSRPAGGKPLAAKAPPSKPGRPKKKLPPAPLGRTGVLSSGESGPKQPVVTVVPVPKAEPPPATDAYRVQDLDGCEVVTESGEVLGFLKDVYPAGKQDVWVVRRGEQEYLVPARREVVLSVDLPARRIMVRLPPGLRDVYEEQR